MFAQPDAMLVDPEVVLICPSFGKPCGIAEYSTHVMRGFGFSGIRATIVRTVAEARQLVRTHRSVRHLIVQHEFGLFDDFNRRLNAGENTAELLAGLRSIETAHSNLSVDILMHSVVQDGPLARIQQFILESGIRLHTFTRAGASVLKCKHLEHGVQEVGPLPESAYTPGFTIGNFGFLRFDRNVESFIELCRATESAFIANFHIVPETFRFPPDKVREALIRHLDETRVQYELSTDYKPETELLEFLSRADCFFMPRNEVGTLSASGSVRLVMNLGKPIIVNPVNCYADLADVCLIAQSPREAVDIVRLLRSSTEFRAKAEERIREFRERNRISAVYARFVEQLRA